jgi:hypothetical protein
VVAAFRKYKAEEFSSPAGDSCGGSGAIQVLQEPSPAKIIVETPQLHPIVCEGARPSRLLHNDPIFKENMV